MAIFRRYAAMFRVGTSFIFSSIKSRSASVTLNLICAVRFLPLMPRSFLPAKRVWDTSQQAIFSRRAAGRRGRKYGKGTPFLCLLFIFSYSPTMKSQICRTFPQKKNAIETIRFHSVLFPVLLCAYSFSTSVISLAVAVTIRMPLSLIPSSSASSCRRLVDFSASLFGKKN